MPALTVGGTTLSVAPESLRRQTIEIGDRSRALDGSLRETIYDRLLSFEAQTGPLDRATALTQYNALNRSTQPQTVGGDMASSSGGTLTCFTRATDWRPLVSGSTMAVVISYVIEESS